MRMIIVNIFVIIIMILIAGCSNTIDYGNDSVSNTENDLSETKDPVTLGYCPTMEGLAKEIASKNNHVSLQPFGYTAQALQTLNSGSVDLVLVGRLALKTEVNDPFEKHLRGGLTLVGNEKRLIHISQLQNSRVHTAIDEDIVYEYLPDTENIIFHKSTESAITEGINDLVLIDWKDYTDDLQLVIPVDNAGNKIEKFRIPVLYSYDDTNIKNLEV